MRNSVAVAFALLALAAGPARAQHVDVWGAYGIGLFLAGGTSRPNGYRLGALGFELPGDKVEIRALIGTLERVDVPTHGDNDADFRGVDVLVTRQATGLPVDLGLGAAYHEQSQPEGFPERRGPRVFLRRWGPNLAVARRAPLARHLDGFGEIDLHYAPFPRRETFAVAGLGLVLHF